MNMPNCGTECPLEKFRTIYRDTIPTRNTTTECQIEWKTPKKIYIFTLVWVQKLFNKPETTEIHWDELFYFSGSISVGGLMQELFCSLVPRSCFSHLLNIHVLNTIKEQLMISYVTVNSWALLFKNNLWLKQEGRGILIRKIFRDCISVSQRLGQ